MSPEEVNRLLTMEGVNRELRPLIRMTAPSGWSRKPVSEWPVGKTLFSSWILLFGVIPVDRHTFFFQSTDGQGGFTETSRSCTNKLWQHQREIVRSDASCRVTDTVEFECRVAVLAYVLAPIYRLIFRHRHRVLRSCHGGARQSLD